MESGTLKPEKNHTSPVEAFGCRWFEGFKQPRCNSIKSTVSLETWQGKAEVKNDLIKKD